jgi:membrane-associated phospholipid phosphatase
MPYDRGMRRLGGLIFAGILLSAHAGAELGPAAAAPAALDGDADLAPCSDAVPARFGGEAEAAEAPSPPNIGAIALKDAFSILGAPLHWDGKDWLVFGGIAAGVTAVGFAFDIPMRNKTQAHQTSTLDELTKVVEPFGAGYSWAVIGAYGVAGFLFHDPDAKDIFFDSAIASLLASGIITPTLKFVVGRDRPNESVSSTSFHPFSGSDNSFPSGHATQAFAVASVISAHSDQVWVSVAAYSVAGLVGFARIYHNAHWTSDVTAGALIGTFVGRGVVALNKKLRSGDTTVRVAFAPIIGEKVKGAGFLVAF